MQPRRPLFALGESSGGARGHPKEGPNDHARPSPMRCEFNSLLGSLGRGPVPSGGHRAWRPRHRDAAVAAAARRHPLPSEALGRRVRSRLGDDGGIHYPAEASRPLGVRKEGSFWNAGCDRPPRRKGFPTTRRTQARAPFRSHPERSHDTAFAGAGRSSGAAEIGDRKRPGPPDQVPRQGEHQDQRQRSKQSLRRRGNGPRRSQGLLQADLLQQPDAVQRPRRDPKLGHVEQQP